MENNLVRFLLSAILWGTLLAIAWSRQRGHDLPREKLLVWGFGLGALSSLLMAVFASLQLLGAIERASAYAYLVPIERALTMASIVVVAGAFLRYILDDAHLARRYIVVGLGITGACLVLALWQWPQAIAILTEAQLHTTWSAWIFEISLSILIVAAIVLLRRKPGWLSNVVTLALVLFLISEVLDIANYATNKEYHDILCPIGNSLRMLAIPLLGFVYLREQSIEKKRIETDLEAYRLHLEQLVEARTAEITKVNEKLQEEVEERKRAEVRIAHRNASLSAQNSVAAALSRSLDLETILETALDSVLSVVQMDFGLVFLQDLATQNLVLRSCRGAVCRDEVQNIEKSRSCCVAISGEAMNSLQAIVRTMADYARSHPDARILPQELQLLVSVPLVSNNQAVGALTLGSKKSTPIQQSSLELLTAIGQQIGITIENASLHKQLEWAAALEERQRIAADMHDGLAQTVSLLGLQVEEAIDLIQAGTPEQALKELANMQKVVERASSDVRSSITNLKGTSQPQRALQNLLMELPGQLPMPEGAPIKVIDKTQRPVILSQGQSDQVVLIMQEALLNARRHAQAQSINLVLEGSENGVRLTVEDDGTGFIPGAWWETRQDHFGLGILHARAARIGANLVIDSAPGQGTRVSLNLPIQPTTIPQSKPPNSTLKISDTPEVEA